MTNLQARLIAAALALVAGAILVNSTNDEIRRPGFWMMIVAGVLFCVEYIRAQKP